MRKGRWALLGLLLLSACGGGGLSTAAMDNACLIVDEQPRYYRAMQRTEARWGVPVAVQMATIHQESRFDSKARTPYRFALGVIPLGRQSSAYGYAQALDGTWDEYVRESGNRGARRDRIEDATDFIGWYFNKTVQRNGIPLTDARNQYLAYHEGHTGFARGSYRAKGWLVSVSSSVAARADRYQAQLISCRRA
ncbi:MAG: lytic transglycosylase [Rhodobacteraceae bacterium]|nr:lytic transglycosylase [Paracoccaceae bacterium]